MTALVRCSRCGGYVARDGLAKKDAGRLRSYCRACDSDRKQGRNPADGDELLRAADAARVLIVEDGVDPLLALSLVVDPTPAVSAALKSVAA